MGRQEHTGTPLLTQLLRNGGLCYRGFSEGEQRGGLPLVPKHEIATGWFPRTAEKLMFLKALLMSYFMGSVQEGKGCMSPD